MRMRYVKDAGKNFHGLSGRRKYARIALCSYCPQENNTLFLLGKAKRRAGVNMRARHFRQSRLNGFDGNLYAAVAEWQTRRSQKPLGATP